MEIMLKEIFIHDGIKHYKVNCKEISYIETINADIRVQDEEFTKDTLDENYYKHIIKVPFSEELFENFVREFYTISKRWDALVTQEFNDLYWVIQTIDINNNDYSYFGDMHPGNWYELERLLLEYIIPEDFNALYKDLIIILIYYTIATTNNENEYNLIKCLQILDEDKYTNIIETFPDNHPAKERYLLIKYYMENLSMLDKTKLYANIKYIINTYLKECDNMIDFYNFKSDEDVWKLANEIVETNKYPRYIFEYYRLLSILNNKTNTIEMIINKLGYCLSSLRHYIRTIENRSDIQKPNEYDIHAEYKDELFRPLTNRQMACFRNCLVELERGDLKRAFWELWDAFDDYGRSLYKKYISINEIMLFNELIEIFDKHMNSENYNKRK